MPQLRVKEYTKDRLDEILESEDHTSHDSVLKTLLLYRNFYQHDVEELNGTKPERAGGLFPAVVLGDAILTESTVHCGNCTEKQETVIYPRPTTLSGYEDTCSACGAPLGIWTAVATTVEFDIDEHHERADESIDDLFHGLLQLAWERHVREWVEGEKWDQDHIESLAEYARDQEFIDTEVKHVHDARDTVWQPRYKLESRDEFKPNHIYEIPLAGRTGGRAWRVGEIKQDGTITVVKVNGSSGTSLTMDESTPVLGGTSLGALIDDGEVYRVVDY